MRPNFVLLILMLPGLVISDGVSGEWGYDEEENGGSLGPSHWNESFEMCDHGKQSPIDISSPTPDKTLGKLTFHGYNQMPGTITVLHDDHAVKVVPDIKLSISGGSLNYTYTFDHFHFHWGDNDTLGSEHTVNGRPYPLELHFVHWNSDKYSNISEAATKDDGLVVIGLLAGVAADNSSQLNKALGSLTKTFDYVHYVGNETKSTPFKFMDLFPTNLQYYRYQGSLTTPPCLETVTWTIIKDTIYVTHDQAEEFRKFHEKKYAERVLHHSNRPLQPRNGRAVYLSEPFYEARSSAFDLSSNHVMSSVTLAFLVLRLFVGFWKN